ncbi:MAG: DUF3878 family protein [Ruminococcus sp.]|nr:DUF3878 family protein [Ruminococcus sp.]
MDISKIDKNLIERFDSSYTIAEYVFGVEPIAASAKTQKKIRKWIEKNYIGDEIYHQNVMRYIGKEVSDKRFLEFIKACHDQIQLNGTRKKQLFDKFSVDLTEEVKNAIWELLEYDVYCSNVRKAGNDAQINVGYTTGCERTLTLVNASGIPEGRIDCLSFENGAFIKQDDEYILSGEVENYEEDLSTSFSIRFTDAKIDTPLFRADEQLFLDTPWDYLESIAGAILDKYILSAEYLNDREKELLPLIAEISKLSYWRYIPDEFKSADFTQLKFYIIRFEYNELLPLVEVLEKEFFDENKKERIIKKLVSKLNTQKYEPLWREIYNILVKSQENYKSKETVCCQKELLKETRSNIQRLMEFHGYSGQYPDFTKKGSTRGVHLAESYDMSYFVGAKKNVVYHIHCIEEYFNEYFTIQFLCGTELLKKNENAGDIYSCLFNAEGRRLFQTISYESDRVNFDGERETDDLEQRVQIAVKKAELIKLTKKEREEIMGYDFTYWKLFLLVFIGMGGLFGIFMTIGLILIGIVLCLIFAMPQKIPSMFLEIPWWSLFLLAWVLFGGAMGVITVLAKRK